MAHNHYFFCLCLAVAIVNVVACFFPPHGVSDILCLGIAAICLFVAWDTYREEKRRGRLIF